jgi:hypothetical protein
MKVRKREEFDALLRQVVERHCPEHLSKLAKLGELSDSERLALQQAVADELLATGLGDDDEPNERGLSLESLIDFLGRR